ncbi:MAG: hypothetical protein AAFU65_04140, partial [Pseudomonadota bacterium]
VALALVLACSGAWAGAKPEGPAPDPIGYARLVSAYGDALPDGARIDVAQVEPPSRIQGDDKQSQRRTHVPDRSRRPFKGVQFVNVSEDQLDGSGHATSTARLFYGRGYSSAPGVERVHVFTANEFLKGLARPSGLGPARVWNHSWVGGVKGRDSEILRALDRAVTARHWIVVAGVANKDPNPPLLSSGFNLLSVGRSDGKHGAGTRHTSAAYSADRARPHLVAPAAKTSEAAPMVASVATLLLDALVGERDTHGLSRADESLVVRAALLAGARRTFDRGADPAARAQPDYAADASVRTANGLDTRFGAGQLNAWNSYHIVRSGPPAGAGKAPVLPPSGWIVGRELDSSPSSGTKVRFDIVPEQDVVFTAALLWNWTPGRRQLPADLDLQLYDATGKLALTALSDGRGDTGEHLHVPLKGGHRYQLQIVAPAPRHATTAWALAWRTSSKPD